MFQNCSDVKFWQINVILQNLCYTVLVWLFVITVDCVNNSINLYIISVASYIVKAYYILYGLIVIPTSVNPWHCQS